MDYLFVGGLTILIIIISFGIAKWFSILIERNKRNAPPQQAPTQVNAPPQQAPTQVNAPPQQAPTQVNAPPQQAPTQVEEIKKSFYDIVEPRAVKVKIILQMLIGAALTILIILKFSHHLTNFSNQTPPNTNDFFSTYVYNLPTLDIVGLALAYATAIELAYALFTDDLDEAINPLITGLAATILIIVSRPNFKLDVSSGIGIALVILALAGLFIIRRHFIK